MSRHDIAFLVAPAAVPLLLLALAAQSGGPRDANLFAVAVAAAVSYGGTVVLGAPAYLFLRARGLRAVWVAPATGFAVGALMCLAFFVLVFGPAEVRRDITQPGIPIFVLSAGGLGVIVGVLFWIIARPDRDPYRRG